MRLKGRRPRWLLTALGRIRLRRQYVAAADGERFPADAVLGVEGYVTRGAQRMAVLAGARDSFARAEVMLRELAGWELDDEVIRQLTHAAAKSLSISREDRTDDERFAKAKGAVEVQIDAGKVNTTAGWRDIKLCVIGKRKRGKSATPRKWSDRVLPPPASHPTRLGYAQRLASGRSIGSGLIEGSVKQLVNRRMKLTGARWRVEHVGPLVELAAVVDSPEWHDFWTAA